MKKGAIFDMDGLLFDTECLYRESWTATAEHFGLDHIDEFSRDICGATGENLRRVISTYYPQIDMKQFIEYCVCRVEDILTHGVPEKTGVHEIIAMFKRHGFSIAVASSSRRRTIEYNLKHTGLFEYFDVIASGEDIANGKPSPDIYLLAAQKLGLQPSECYAFEDSKNGIIAAHTAGCDAIMIPDMTPPDSEAENLSFAIYKTLSQAAEEIEKII